MKVIAKYVTLLFLDWNSKRDFTSAYKEGSASND